MTMIPIKEKHETFEGKNAFYPQLLSIFSGYILMLDVGAHSGWPSPALPHLTSEKSEFPVSMVASSWLVSIINISGIMGNILCSALIDKIGRRLTLLLFALVHLISWILIYFSHSYEFLLTARFIGGFGTGGSFGTLALYIGEISHKKNRGTFLSLDKFFLSIGTFLINVLGGFLPFRTMNLIMIIVPLISICLFPFMLETPYYYLMKNQDEDALKALMKSSGAKEQNMVLEDFRRIKEAVMESRISKNSSFYEVFSDKGSRKGLISILITEITFVFAGLIAIHAYAQEIFSYSGSSLDPAHAAMIMTGVQIIAGLPSSVFSDKWGRRPIYLISGLTSALTLGTVGLFFFLKYFLQINVSGITWLPLVSLVMYQFTSNIGLSTIPFIYSGELFSIKVKGTAMICYFIVGSICSFCTKMMLPFVNAVAGIYTTFWIFTGTCVIGPILVVCITPETKDKTLEEVLELLRGKKKKNFVT